MHQNLEVEENTHVMEVYCDSDGAGGLYRRSTTSIVILLNSLVVLSYSRTQKAVSLSSCEAEVLSLTSGASEAILLREVWQFMVQQVVLLEARSDSSSGRQWLQRAGLGGLKHIVSDYVGCRLPYGSECSRHFLCLPKRTMRFGFGLYEEAVCG